MTITSVAPNSIVTPAESPPGINISGSGFEGKQIFDIDLDLSGSYIPFLDYVIVDDGTIVGHIPAVLVPGTYTVRIRYTDASSDTWGSIALVPPASSGSGSATYDITSPVGQVRLLAFDTNMADPIFTDAEIQFFLQINNETVRLAAAQVVERIALTETYLQKHIKTSDVERDGPGEAAALLSVARLLRQQEFEYGDNFTGLFDYAEVVYDAWGMRERVRKQYWRQMI